MTELTIVQPTDQPLLSNLFRRMFTDAPEAYGKTMAEAESAAAEESAMWERYLARIPDAIGVIAWAEGQPCGFVMGCVGKLVNGNLDDNYTDVVTLGRMWVDPVQRRRGIATTLIETIETWTRQKGIQRLELWVMAANHAAHTLYRHAGYRHAGFGDNWGRPDEPFPFLKDVRTTAIQPSGRPPWIQSE